MNNHFDAVVVGGGITGNASALSLAQCGLRVALLAEEQTPTSTDAYDARVYALSHSSVQLLQNLRVWDALDHSRMCAVTDMRIMGDAAHGERQQGVLNFSAYSAHQSELAWIVEQNNIQKGLQQAISFSPHITRIAANASTMQVDDKCVHITTHSSKVLSADLVVGSDGAQSWVRTNAGIAHDEFDYQQCGVVAHFTCALPHHGCAHQWFLADGAVLALLPLPNQQVSMVYSCATQISTELLQYDAQTLATHISALSHHVLGELVCEQPAQAFPLKRMKARRFVGSKIVLVGDAAHTVHPLAGQGLNLGLQDVACLQRVITQREAHRSIGDTVLLRRYERERVAATAQMQGVTHALQQLFHHSHPVTKHARNLGMNLLDIAPPLKRWLIKSAIGKA